MRLSWSFGQACHDKNKADNHLADNTSFLFYVFFRIFSLHLCMNTAFTKRNIFRWHEGDIFIFQNLVRSKSCLVNSSSISFSYFSIKTFNFWWRMASLLYSINSFECFFRIINIPFAFIVLSFTSTRVRIWMRDQRRWFLTQVRGPRNQWRPTVGSLEVWSLSCGSSWSRILRSKPAK